MFYVLSEILYQFWILLTLFHLLVFILYDLIHQILFHKSYLSNLFIQILCQCYLHQFWNSIILISKLLYHQLIYLHHFHLFCFLYHAVLYFHKILYFLICFPPITYILLSSILLRCQIILFIIFFHLYLQISYGPTVVHNYSTLGLSSSSSISCW